METQTSTSDETLRDAYVAYAIYADAFKTKTYNKETQIQGLRALVKYIDAMVALGRGTQCAVVMAWDGGEPSHVADASERRAKALAKIASLSE